MRWRRLFAWFDQGALAQWAAWLAYPGVVPPAPPVRRGVSGLFWTVADVQSDMIPGADIRGAMWEDN
jgi:hypothetical protein